jgi:hypothetical protein
MSEDHQGSTSIIYLSHSHTIMRSERGTVTSSYLRAYRSAPRLNEQAPWAVAPAVLERGTVTRGDFTDGTGNLVMISFYLAAGPATSSPCQRALFEDLGVQYSLDSRIPSSLMGSHPGAPPHWWGDPRWHSRTTTSISSSRS